MNIPLMLYQYYKLPIMCLLRIKDSIDLWEKNSGANGYFDFIEGYMGAEIQGDEMKFSVHCKDSTGKRGTII